MSRGFEISVEERTVILTTVCSLRWWQTSIITERAEKGAPSFGEDTEMPGREKQRLGNRCGQKPQPRRLRQLECELLCQRLSKDEIARLMTPE
jgi:hypothetical protein